MSLYNFEQIEFKKQHHVNAFITAIDNSSFHWHYEYEIIIVLKGSLMVFTNPKPVLLKTDDILLINTKTVHSIKRTDEENICMIIQLAPSLFQNESQNDVTYHFYLNSTESEVPVQVDDHHFVKLAAKLTKLFLQNERTNYHRIRALVFQLIADLFDYVIYDMNYQSKTVSNDSKILMEIVEYIEKNIHSDQILEQLCTDLGFSKKTVYRYLKENIGLSAKKLIDNMRIDKAKQLLKYSNKSIGYITDTCGFGSESTFYRIFQQREGITPSEYRKKDVPVEKDPEIQGYLSFRHKEAMNLLSNILKEENDVN
ncbi:AraC family transcriptional regulator [Neobacillus drentensis]|uniref:AraC family transcriptional regulator n=1 Tax=Neobacillus drentensis TaxID=220684 RepID=UPI002FFF1550